MSENDGETPKGVGAVRENGSADEADKSQEERQEKPEKVRIKVEPGRFHHEKERE